MSNQPPATVASTWTKRQVYACLHQYFGFEEFRLGQADVIRSILQGKETVAVLPTGGGKSLCYQLPALLFGGTTLVISPLIALMRDQVQALRARGIPAASLDSHQDWDERDQVYSDFRQGSLKLLYVSPERLGSANFLRSLEQVDVPLVAVDEAHCVLRWGHEFREAYLGIQNFLQQLNPGRIAAFTATATPQLRSELAEALGLQTPEVIVRGFLRPNLELVDARMDSDASRWRQLVAAVRAAGERQACLVYAATRQTTEDAAAALVQAGIAAEYYHAGCEAEHRSTAQDAFLQNRLQVLVATNAFGMGIDKPDIRLLVHLSLPRSFEDYYQEVGRAGRDGKPSRALLLWRGADYRTQNFLIEQQPDPMYREAAQRRLNRVYESLRGRRCLWKHILEYFGDPDVNLLAQGCGHCSRCLQPGGQERKLKGAELALAQGLLFGVHQLDGRYGRSKILKILRGSKAKGIPTWPTCYATMKSFPQSAMETMLQSLLDGGYCAVEGSEYPKVVLTLLGARVLAEEAACQVHYAPSSR